MPDTDLLTIQEAAAILRVVPLTMKNWRDRGEGPPWIKIGPRAIRYRRSSLMAYLAKIERVAS